MKKTITILSFMFAASLGFAQTYSSPESVEFDYANNRWFIGNHGSTGAGAHTIITRNSATGALSPFASGLTTGPHGLEIVNDTLYACDGSNLRGYNINTGALVFNINLGASFLNGITHDNTGYLYITDFSAYTIYRFNTSTRAFSIFVASTGTASPNGIIYDQPNNRCVFVNWGASAPIKAMDIVTGAVSTIITSTLGNCDGIAKDGTGNYYVSSWTGNKITRFTNTFTTPTTVVTGLSSPADIFYNTLTDTLGNPNSGTLNNTTYHYFGSSAAIDESEKNKFNLSVFPNPIGKAAEIKYETSAQEKVLVQLFDVTGQLIRTIAEEDQSAGKHTLTIDRSGMAAGNYFIKITVANSVETKKIVIGG